MHSYIKQDLSRQPANLLSVVLWLTALHSFSMGLMLIIQPLFIIKAVGFGELCEHFFPAQGGVFHILMGVAYLMGAFNAEKYRHLIVFAIIVKAAATLFLMTYCFTVEFKWIILLSGVSDFIMGLAIFITWQNNFYHRKFIQQRAYK